MKDEKPENPLAFPSVDTLNREVRVGMDLRDYFAAKAMQSAIEFYGLPERVANENWIGPGIDALTSGAYGIADAMLKERNKA